MRKLILIVIFFAFSPNNSFAISGACSYHGGVNCSAGQDYDGSVTCNDGTRDSSVAYGDMSMCKSLSPSLSDLCPLPFIAGATRMSSCDDYQRICDSRIAGIRNALLQSGAGGRGSVAQYASESASQIDTSCPEAVSCREQVTLYNRQMELHELCVKDAFKSLENQKLNIEKQILNKQCQDKLGDGAYSSNYSGKCVCPTGKYISSDGKCVTEQEESNTYDFLCKHLYGQNSHASSTNLSLHDCSCDFGYEVDKTGKCVTKTEKNLIKNQISEPRVIKSEIKVSSIKAEGSSKKIIKMSTTSLVVATNTKSQVDKKRN
jgi:hypothetical protein